MILFFGFALLLQGQSAPPKTKADSITREVLRQIDAQAVERARRVSVRAAARAGKSAAPRAVTERDLATAFKDAGTRTLFERAREARLAQDATLLSYDATAYQRSSASVGFSAIGRERLAFRNEQVGRVQWRRDVGVWVTLQGARTVIPASPDIGEREARKGLAQAGSDMIPIPYFPGADALWAGIDVAKPSVDVEGPIHPLAAGAEAYYTYQRGDSLSFRLPDGTTIRLQELAVRPRDSAWNEMVGSLWFDVATARVVRAAYRFAVPMRIDEFVLEQDPTAFDDVPKWVKPLMFPMYGEVSAVTIEYGLHEGRFWLPRLRTAQGIGRASFVRVPFKIEQSFKYASVNGRDSIPPIVVATPSRPPDSLDAAGRQKWRDSVNAVRIAAARARRDSIRAGQISGRRIRQCDTSDVEITISRRTSSRMPVATRTPCNLASLENSPALPKSIYDPGDDIFDLKARDALIAEALTMGVQPPIIFNPLALPKPTFFAGLHQMRYNRVEGFSPGIAANQILGGGYTLDALGRFGTADRRVGFEAALTRSNLANAVYVSGYNGIVAAGDWGDPLSFGSSLSAALFGRDEGFYYRAGGVSIGARHEPDRAIEWRLFVEQQRTANVATAFSVAGSNDLPNIAAKAGTYKGFALRVRNQHGLDPRGLRLFTDLRLETAAGDSLYGRGAVDLTLMDAIGDATGALTLSAGSSAGAVPAQRRWYLGGARTIRGQGPDTAQAGTAYWMARGEVGRIVQGVRPAVFADVGWVGDRDRWREVGRPMSGVGTGLSIMDGLMRFDVARGVFPRKQWRFDAYLEAVF